MSKGGGKTVETRQDTSPWGPQQAYLTDLFSRAQGLYGQGPQQYFPGQTVAAQSPNTQQALARMSASANDPNSLTNQAAGQFGKTIQGDYLNADSNPYLKGAVNDTMNQVQSRVAGTFGTRGGNNYGSSAHQEWLGRSLADAALPIYAQNYETERGRQLNAAQYAPQAEAAGWQQLGQAGVLQDAQQQRLIDAEKARFDFNQQSPWDALQRYQGAVAGNYGGMTNATQPYQRSNDFLNAAGLGLMAYGAFSDRRLKRDIERIGTHPSGVPLYSFRYLNDDTPRIGVMADEVEKVMPEAVGERDGFKTVNYAMLEAE